MCPYPKKQTPLRVLIIVFDGLDKTVEKKRERINIPPGFEVQEQVKRWCWRNKVNAQCISYGVESSGNPG